MKILSPLILASLILTTGCLKPNSSVVQAQSTSLEDSIRFTQLTVTGNGVLLQISRDGSVPASTRGNGVDPVDFPEYMTFEKDASGSLQSIPSHTRLGLKIEGAACSDPTCSQLTVTLSRPGGMLSDKVTLVVKRVPTVSCGIVVIAPNGAPTVLNPKFDFVTLTTTKQGNSVGSNGAFYGQVTFLSATTGLRTTLYARNFLGGAAELWLDQLDYAIPTDGIPVLVSTSATTFDAERLDPQTPKAINLYAADRAGTRVSINCTY